MTDYRARLCAGVAALAVSFLWSNVNPDHEVAAVEAIRARWPDIPVTAFGAERGMSRLFINIGSKDGLRPSDVVGAIANEAQIPGKSIGVIEIKDTYSFVEIPDHLAEKVVDAIQGSRIRNREVRVEIARPRDGAPQGGDRQAGDRRDRSARDGHPPRSGGRDDRSSRTRRDSSRPRKDRER